MLPTKKRKETIGDIALKEICEEREKKTEGRIGKRKIRNSENGERKLRKKIRKKEKQKSKFRSKPDMEKDQLGE